MPTLPSTAGAPGIMGPPMAMAAPMRMHHQAISWVTASRAFPWRNFSSTLTAMPVNTWTTPMAMAPTITRMMSLMGVKTGFQNQTKAPDAS